MHSRPLPETQFPQLFALLNQRLLSLSGFRDQDRFFRPHFGQMMQTIAEFGHAGQPRLPQNLALNGATHYNI